MRKPEEWARDFFEDNHYTAFAKAIQADAYLSGWRAGVEQAAGFCAMTPSYGAWYAACIRILQPPPGIGNGEAQ